MREKKTRKRRYEEKHSEQYRSSTRRIHEVKVDSASGFMETETKQQPIWCLNVSSKEK